MHVNPALHSLLKAGKPLSPNPDACAAMKGRFQCREGPDMQNCAAPQELQCL